MIRIPKGSLEDLVRFISQVRAQLAVSAIREEARKRGLDRMTEEEADHLVQETRAGYKTRKND